MITALRLLLPLSLLVAAVALPAQTPITPAPSRGELLYQTHCVACHDKQVHWRDHKIVTDWTILTAEVRRWASNVGLRWPDATVEEVVRYLNATIYRFPDQARRQTG